VPIMKLNYGEDIFFQEDNSAVHKARKVQNFLILQWYCYGHRKVQIWTLLKTSRKCCQMLCMMVHNLQTRCLCFKKSIWWSICAIKRNMIKNLYAGIRSRFCKVLICKEGLSNVCGFPCVAKKYVAFHFYDFHKFTFWDLKITLNKS